MLKNSMDVPLAKESIEIIKQKIKKKKLFYSFLEVGCGDGFNLKELSNMGLKGVGIDRSSEAIKQAKERNLKNIKVFQEDFMDLKIKTKMILILNVLEHVEKDVKFLERAYESLEDDGFLIVEVPSDSTSYGFADLNAGHYRRYSKTEIIQKLQEVGFRIDETLSVGFPVCNIYTTLFNMLNKDKFIEGSVSGKTEFSGLKTKEGYYPSPYQELSKVAFPILSELMKIDRLFLNTNLGNYLIIFAKR